MSRPPRLTIWKRLLPVLKKLADRHDLSSNNQVLSRAIIIYEALSDTTFGDGEFEFIFRHRATGREMSLEEVVAFTSPNNKEAS